MGGEQGAQAPDEVRLLEVMREATEGPDEDWMDDDLYDDEYDDEEDYDGDWLTPSLPVIGIEDADDYDYDEDLGLG